MTYSPAFDQGSSVARGGPMVLDRPARKRKPTTRAKTIRLPSADEEDLRDLEDILELAELFDYLEAA